MTSAVIEARGLRATVHRHADEASLAHAVADVVKRDLSAAIAARNRASMVVTGGTTPHAYYPEVAALDLPWEKVSITLSDERWVPLSHAASNERLVCERLLQGHAASARFVGLFNHEPTAAAGAETAAGRVQTLPHPYDLVLIGLGADMHIASLFPTAPELAEALSPASEARCVAVTPPAYVNPNIPRLSLTLNELLDSRHIVIAARGRDKLDAFEAALAAPLGEPVLPVIELLRRAPHTVEWYWAP